MAIGDKPRHTDTFRIPELDRSNSRRARRGDEKDLPRHSDDFGIPELERSNRRRDKRKSERHTAAVGAKLAMAALAVVGSVMQGSPAGFAFAWNSASSGIEALKRPQRR